MAFLCAGKRGEERVEEATLFAGIDVSKHDSPQARPANGELAKRMRERIVVLRRGVH